MAFERTSAEIAHIVAGGTRANTDQSKENLLKKGFC